jgi:hypothetical protein
VSNILFLDLRYFANFEYCRRKSPSQHAICRSRAIKEDEREDGRETEDGLGGSDDAGCSGGGMKNRVGEMEGEGNDVQVGVAKNLRDNREVGGEVVRGGKGEI